VTSVVITHDMASALKIAHRVYLLANGEIVTHGTPDEFVASHHELAQSFLKSSGVAIERLAEATGEDAAKVSPDQAK
jgi:ABC-type transporter Mla maintaining outer membrane lipid asymmetry ATPase subunit MlaF